ncbi:unnamed protein product [Timema podura]|uniref:CYRIA/CYRIB Rac1 binding domain-containing protein n=1 Tax=Timema podura TaxID=61482 RepID=A0ABN7P526_TIMPD|nr:unnamed protein product [Timema podura]
MLPEYLQFNTVEIGRDWSLFTSNKKRKIINHAMKTPAIQNDFSYYRRTMTRQRMSSQDGLLLTDTREVTNELANRMSLFYAHATPMLKVLSEATTRFVAEPPHPYSSFLSYSLSRTFPSLYVCHQQPVDTIYGQTWFTVATNIFTTYKGHTLTPFDRETSAVF